MEIPSVIRSESSTTNQIHSVSKDRRSSVEQARAALDNNTAPVTSGTTRTWNPLTWF